MTIEFSIRQFLEPCANLDFYDIHTRKYLYSITSQDRLCNKWYEPTDYDRKFIRNISIYGGKFNGVIIMFNIPVSMIDGVMKAIAFELTNSDIFRAFIRNCIIKKLVYPDGLKLNGFNIQIDDELLK